MRNSTWAPQRCEAMWQEEHGVAKRFPKDTVGFLFIANFSLPTSTIEISSNKIDSILNHGGTDRQEYVECNAASLGNRISTMQRHHCERCFTTAEARTTASKAHSLSSFSFSWYEDRLDPEVGLEEVLVEESGTPASMRNMELFFDGVCVQELAGLL